jgi:hypothetical protein
MYHIMLDIGSRALAKYDAAKKYFENPVNRWKTATYGVLGLGVVAVVVGSLEFSSLKHEINYLNRLNNLHEQHIELLEKKIQQDERLYELGAEAGELGSLLDSLRTATPDSVKELMKKQPGKIMSPKPDTGYAPKARKRLKNEFYLPDLKKWYEQQQRKKDGTVST